MCRAVELARRAAGGDGLVALDIGPTGKLLQPLGDLAFEEAYQAFREMAQAGEKAGADCILIETFSDTYEVKAAVLAAKESTSLPVIVTMIFDERGKLLTGGDIPAAAALLEGLGVDALGFNCGAGPEQMKALLPQLLDCCALPGGGQSECRPAPQRGRAHSFRCGSRGFCRLHAGAGRHGTVGGRRLLRHHPGAPGGDDRRLPGAAADPA